MTGGLPLRDAQALAVDAERAGFDGMVVTEGGRTAHSTRRPPPWLRSSTWQPALAVAFPRSPMVTACRWRWELAQASGGRFRLGLGTQESGRTSSAATPVRVRRPPGLRLREYVRAVRACFEAFKGRTPLSFEGDYWSMNLLPAQWTPGPLDVPDPPIDVAAVNPWMLRMAAEVADGIHVHPLNTPTYLETTVVPAAGAAELIIPAFTAPGETADEQERWRVGNALQVAFHGSINYAFIFEQLGRSRHHRPDQGADAALAISKGWRQ